MYMENERANGVLEDFRLDFLACWQRLPNKGFFVVLLAAWLALFHFLGSSTLGYVHSPSLFRWALNAYHPTGDYLDAEEGHGVIVPFVVLGLFWWKRKELLAQPLELWTPGLGLIGLALVLHLLGYFIQQPRLSMVGFFAGVYGIMGLAWGPGWLRASFFPFILFAFCIPLGPQIQPITFALRMLVCRLVEWVSHAVLAIDVVRDGTALRDPTNHYSYEVAAACSGLRSLVATVGLALGFGFLFCRAWWRRGVLLLAAVPLAVIGNLVRMLTIVIAAEIGGQKAGDYIHEGGPLGIISLLPYVPPFFGLMLLADWFQRREAASPGKSGAGSAATPDRLPAQSEPGAAPLEGMT